MKIDISTQYTKERNTKCGRNGYCGAQREKVTAIPISHFGAFLINNRKRK